MTEEYVDPLIEPFTNRTLTIANLDISIPPFSTSPCVFDPMSILTPASKIVGVAEWIDDQFEFFELFWRVYGVFLTKN